MREIPDSVRPPAHSCRNRRRGSFKVVPQMRERRTLGNSRCWLSNKTNRLPVCSEGTRDGQQRENVVNDPFETSEGNRTWLKDAGRLKDGSFDAGNRPDTGRQARIRLVSIIRRCPMSRNGSMRERVEAVGRSIGGQYENAILALRRYGHGGECPTGAIARGDSGDGGH